MSLYATYQKYKQGKITEEEIAQEYGLSLRVFRLRRAKLKDRLEETLTVLDKIHSGAITRHEAAETLGVTARQVNNLQTSWKIKRPLAEYLISRATSKVKWEVRKNYAIEFIADSLTLDDAAEHANVSVRQMRRWVTELLKKHHGMVFRDLRELTHQRRLTLADEIEEAEGLENAKRSVIQAVAMGEKAIREVALERVLSKRRIAERTHVREQPGSGTEDRK